MIKSQDEPKKSASRGHPPPQVQPKFRHDPQHDDAISASSTYTASPSLSASTTVPVEFITPALDDIAGNERASNAAR